MGNYWLDKGKEERTLEEVKVWYQELQANLELDRQNGKIIAWTTELHKNDNGTYRVYAKMVQPIDHIELDLIMGDNNG